MGREEEGGMASEAIFAAPHAVTLERVVVQALAGARAGVGMASVSMALGVHKQRRRHVERSVLWPVCTEDSADRDQERLQARIC
jgi:hypothetical protein